MTTSAPPARPLNLLSNICFCLGFVSIIGSILIWLNPVDETYEAMAHAERLSLFVGLWVPTLFILSNRFDRYADKTTWPNNSLSRT